MKAWRTRATVVALVAIATASLGPGAAAGAPRPIREARRAALRDVYRRLVEVRLPPGAHPVKSVGRGLHLDGPGSVPATPNVVGMHSYFLSPRPREAVVAWLEAHPVVTSGLRESGSFGIDGRTVVKEVGFEWPELPGRIRERKTQFAVAARPRGGSAIRVETQAVWITPHPAAATIPAGSRFIDVRLRKRGKLRSSKVISDQAEVGSIAKLIDGFEVSQPGTVHCPLLPERDERLTLMFRHSRRGPVLARVEQEVPPGCGRPLELTIGARKPKYLEEGYMLLRRLRPILDGGTKDRGAR